MALTLSSTLVTSLSWVQTDTQDNNARISDNGSLVVGGVNGTGFSAGTGYGQVNTLFHDIRTIMSGSGSEQLNLSSLPRSLFGGSYDVSFSGGTIKGLVIKNNSAGTGVSGVLTNRDLIINGTGANGWSVPFGGATGIRIKPEAPFLLINKEGWTVDASNTMINVQDSVGDGITYEVAIIGVV